MVANALERRNNTWVLRTEVASDLIVQVGKFSFHLHKLPMVSRSGYINRLVFQKQGVEDKTDPPLVIHLNNLPGGAKAFETVVRFCYGLKFDLTASNIAPSYCAAHFLEMTEDFHESNLLSETEVFLSFVILSSWKDTFLILKSCESLSPWAVELRILKRCSDSICQKACNSPEGFIFGNEIKRQADNWWFEDVSSLRIDHFIEVLGGLKRRGMKAKLVGSCIADWTEKWLSRVTLLDNVTLQKLTYQLQRITIESLIRLLPPEENSVSCNFLLKLLRLGIVMETDPELTNQLDLRIGSMLDRCHVTDLLVKNFGDNEVDTTYDVGVVVRAVESYVSSVSWNPRPKIHAIGRLVDGYLAFIAREKNLRIETFCSLLMSLPKSVHTCDDNLYRAIDMYLKAHPHLTEEERVSICRALDHNKLTKEAREHVMKNDRLPMSMTTRLILLEQVNMMRSMTGTGSNFLRTKTQAVIRSSARKGSGEQLVDSQKEIRMMKEEVDIVKLQLSQLQMCRMELQVKMRRGVR
ncbi:coleoptile phototropism protein 1-like [Punica granatum]|uniref:Coleoptile phototropism protein 1-like n=2 Tax=Punica granatum TaxID=22663 RepID=A0A6P8DZ35_PUNGR|nr:coleoptile phototropism protein 1-like [Punica granatum]